MSTGMMLDALTPELAATHKHPVRHTDEQTRQQKEKCEGKREKAKSEMGGEGRTE
jgi:hypothetical protein